MILLLSFVLIVSSYRNRMDPFSISNQGGPPGGGIIIIIVTSYRKIMDPFSISNPLFFRGGGGAPVLLLFRREGCGEAGGK